METICKNREETGLLAGEIHSKLLKLGGVGAHAVIVCLSGELGTGKTTLVGFLAEHFGIESNIISPTFVIMKNYKVRDSCFKTLVHIDAYRLESSDELAKLGWQEILENGENIIFVEWPERVGGLLPENCVKIELRHLGGDVRQIKILWPEKKKTKK